jgi:thymidine kinase
MNNPFSDDRYRKIALDKRKAYQAAKPYPHIVIDNFLPKELAEDISNEYPNPKNQNKLIWNHHNNKNVDRFFLDDTKFFPPNLFYVNSAVQQRQFLSFLETISGIDGLIPDPYLIGGGLWLRERVVS